MSFNGEGKKLYMSFNGEGKKERMVFFNIF